jgi:hypothetical protein
MSKLKLKLVAVNGYLYPKGDASKALLAAVTGKTAIDEEELNTLQVASELSKDIEISVLTVY